ncbi:YigZ family protein [Allofustis seminis]|uniref:YigZ family protein n=1 Tax=Allofustis seminis TaxID=166939 RepID=UPI00038151B1|nr:YigZ family protein [Allofustis seminis]
MDNYRTIKKEGIHEIEIKKSKFITHLKRVQSKEEALTFIDSVKKEHWKATHNCSAFTIGMNDELQRADDDGEPSGTAGVPMLEILKKKEVKNVAAVVTRYFGGIKLGAGGLIRAYSGSVNDALAAIGIVERKRQLFIHITVSYPQSGRIENLLRDSTYLLHDIEYTDQVTFICVVPISEKEVFLQHVTEWTNNQFSYVIGQFGWIEVDAQS